MKQACQDENVVSLFVFFPYDNKLYITWQFKEIPNEAKQRPMQQLGAQKLSPELFKFINYRTQGFLTCTLSLVLLALLICFFLLLFGHHRY